MKATITIDLTATLTGRPVRNDYGVPRSPVWTEIEDVQIETVHMFGSEWTDAELRAEFGNLADWIIGSVEEDEFE